jgi:hypothetical protein
MAESKPLVTGFSDLTFIILASFTNEQYQERASYSGKKTNINAVKLEQTYLLKCIWPYRDASFQNDYLVTGEHNLDFVCDCYTVRSSYPLIASKIIERDILKDLVSKNPFNKKETNPPPVILESEVYLNNCEDVFPMRIKFKPSRGGLLMMSTEIEFPHGICDEWYVLFAKYHSQRVHGPRLPQL